MLSIEDTSGPSCTCKASALKSDERPDDELAFQEADLVNLDEIQATNFSIRDYVFGSRIKDLKKNWPFSQHSLHLCLNQNVKGLLPPFQPAGLVTSNCCRKIEECQELVASSGLTDFNSLEVTEVGQLHAEPDVLNPELSFSSDQLLVGNILDDEIDNGATVTVTEATNHDSLKDSDSDPASGVASEIKVAEPSPVAETSDISCKTSAKKCRLIVRFGPNSGSRRSEDIASTSGTVSDSMASKLCPVCKTFTSTSNTTLNAHIDQCLSTESNNELVETQSLQFKVKPRKKRLMVDIYTTAPYCTLEDLDRRNGTNWATDLSLVAKPKEVYTEIKRPKLTPLDNMDDGSEGAVYVDSNGRKLRILSMFNDTPPLEHLQQRKQAKGSKVGSKALLGKKHFKAKQSKNMKLKVQKKKVCVLADSEEETQVAKKGDDIGNTNQKEESLSQILLTEEHVRSSEPARLKEWACSKRSGISKKRTKSDAGKSSSNKMLIAKDQSLEKNQPDSRNCSAARSYIPNPKFSRCPEDLVSPMKTNSLDLPSTTAHTKIKKSKSSKIVNLKSRLSLNCSSLATGLTMKLSRLAADSSDSLETRREEIDVGIMQKSDIYSCTTAGPSESCRPSMEANAGSAPKKNAFLGGSSTEASKIHGAKERLTSKKIRKHRSLLRSGVLHRKLCGSIDTSHDLARCNETSKILPSNISDNSAIVGTEGTLDELLKIQNQMPESEQGKEYSGEVKRQKFSFKRMHMGGECHDTGVETVGRQTEASICADTLTEYSMGNAVDVLNRPAPGSNANVDRTKTQAKSSLYTHELEMQEDDAISNELISQSSQAEGFVDYKVGNVTVQLAGCETDTAATQNLNPHIVHSDMVLNFHQDKPLMTVMRNQDHDLATVRDPSGSPMSTLSHPSPEDYRFKDSEEDMSVRSSEVRDKLSLLSSPGLPLSANTRASEGMNFPRRSEEFKMIAPAKQLERFMDNRSCCCSCKETLSQESQLLKQTFMEGSIFPSWEKQTNSDMYMRPAISSSSSAYPSSRPDDMAVHAMESFMGSPYHPVKLTSFIDSGPGNPLSQVQVTAASNPILRLMGKNLVVNKEDCPEELPNVLPFYSNYFPNSSFASNQSSFSYNFHHHSGPSVASSRLPPEAANNHLMPMPYQEPQWRNLKMKPSNSMQQQVIVIDDSVKHDWAQKRSTVNPAITSPLPAPCPNLAQRRPLPCFPSHYPFLSGEAPSAMNKPSFPISRPRVNHSTRKQGVKSEGLHPLLPNSYSLPSPSSGQVVPSMYCPPAFR